MPFPAHNLWTKGVRSRVSSIVVPSPDPLVVSVDDYTAIVQPIQAASQTLTATHTGGVGSFTYQWEKLSGDSGLDIIDEDTGQSITVGSSGEAEGNYTDTFRVTVTDTGDSNATATADSVVDLTWISSDSEDSGGTNTVTTPNWGTQPYWQEK